jgi:cephalosporin-C deacetylase
MPLYDLSPDELAVYAPAVAEPSDFDAFWAGTLAETRGHALALEDAPVQTGLTLVTTSDVAFSGYGGERIRAWLHLPAGADEPLPCVVEYVGYGGGRGLPHETLVWPAAGYAHLVMDTRGQGSSWRSGETPDPERDGANPQHPGFMTRGVLDPRSYYYRRLIADAVRAVDAARSHPGVDETRIVVCGASQGGGLALAAAALADDVAGVLSDVPFLCHIRRGVEVSPEDPYAEVADYLKVHRGRTEQVFTTLSYVDGVNFARRATTPALMSVALMDEVCPPSTVYAAYNHYAGPKELAAYEFNGHEGGEAYHVTRQLRWVAERFRS